MNDELSGTGLLTTEEVCPERMPRLSLPRSFTRLNAKKQSAILKQLTDAATAAIDKGWYVFPAPYLTKTTFKGTRGSKDARNDEIALAKWKSSTCRRSKYREEKWTDAVTFFRWARCYTKW
jgi:hypothetical protein